MQSDSKISNTFADIVIITGVKFLLILLAKKTEDLSDKRYTDLDFIPDSNEDDMIRLNVVTGKGHP